MRARNWLQEAASSAPFAYDALIRLMEDQAGVVARAPDRIAAWVDPPLFSILMPVSKGADPALVAAAVASIERQCYDRWEIVVAGAGADRPALRDHPRVRIAGRQATDDADALRMAIEAAAGVLVVPWTIATELAETALFRFAEAHRAAPDAALFYGDQDSINQYGHRSAPWLKPEWNPEMILALDFVSRSYAVGAERARAALSQAVRSPGCAAYALMLSAAGHEDDVVHIPHIVSHVRQDRVPDDQRARVNAVSGYVAGAGGTAAAGPFGTVTVRWPAPDPAPLVTILVPTRDRADLLRACVGSVLDHTHYRNYTLVIIDNGSSEPDTHTYFEEIARDPRVQVLPCPMPYNFSAINNFAAERASGEYFCFLNNDTQVAEGDWLGEMMRYAVRPEIGAVGAKLLYEDNSIQHAGVVMGLGNAAGHAHRGLPAGDAGYFAQAHAAHYASAVTAACLVVERRKFEAVGGFDAEKLQIAYNDVDLCLKLGRAGWRNVYAPQATLFHLESKSRGADLSLAHITRYTRELKVLQTRWGTKTIVDPMHHVGLDRASETFRFRL
ncbi:MAG: glycosyltransferase family 2 protein [Janthinobacterium lividum]